MGYALRVSDNFMIIILIFNSFTMSYTNQIASQLLNCWYLDIDFLDNLLESYKLDLDIEELNSIYWKVDNVNILIYWTFEEIKNMFLQENKEAIHTLWFNITNFQLWRDYEIFTNYLDSHLRFNDDSLDELFQNWRRH